MAYSTRPKNRLRQLSPNPLAGFDSFVEQVLGQANQWASNWRAPASLWEADDRFHLEFDAPGVAKDGVDVTLDKGVLTVKVERTRPEGREFHYNERGFGELTRSVTLPDTVDPESVEAELTDGVLHVSIAKTPEAKPRKIELK